MPRPRLSRRGLLTLVAGGVAVGAVAGSAELLLEHRGGRRMFRPATLKPAQVLDLHRWKVNLPVANQQVIQPELASHADESFRVVPAVQFTARCGDDPQPGAKYPRSELREMDEHGTAASWDPSAGTHVMELTQRVTHLPEAKPELVCGQIHNADDYLILIELAGSRLFARYHDLEIGVLDADYRLGTYFDLRIQVVDGDVDVSYNGVSKARHPLTEPGCYFKAGCYLQSNTNTGDLPTAYGQVEISRLTVTHDIS